MTTKLDKIIRTIDLANSDRREDAYESIIIDVLFNYNESLTVDEIFELINSEYSIKPNKNELFENIELLTGNNKIEFSNNKYSLSSDLRLKVQSTFLKNQESKKIRDNNLKEIIINLSKIIPSTSDLDQISNAFYNYIHECFLVYGANAINFFISSVDNNHEDKESIVNKILSDFKISPYKEVFTQLLQEYAIRLNSSDLEYLMDLALKAEGFFSICLNKETYEEIQKADILDWTIFLDTNFLYSILNLHNHPENNACKEIVELAKRNIGIKLKYLPVTLVELKKKKRELEESIPYNRYTNSQLRALIASNQIDDYAKQYFKEKLIDSNTPHPSEKIDFAQQILSANSISIFSPILRTLTEDDKFLTKRYQEYVDYLHMLNEVRVSAGLDEKRDRAPDKIDHDVLLRESIIVIRGKYDQINNSKYYGITLDKVLIKFDRNILGKKRTDIINPTFFFPSFLLKRFRKLMPLETDNYKRAFIAAISSRTFDTDKPRSIVAQRTVGYFKKLGIDNEELILECLNNDIFLKEIEKNEKTNTVDVFLESEISRKISILDTKNIEISTELLQKDNHLTQIKEDQLKKNEIIRDLKTHNEVLSKKVLKIEDLTTNLSENENKLATYEEEISDLRKDVKLLNEQLSKDRAEKAFYSELENYNSRKEKFINSENEIILKSFKTNRIIVILYALTFISLITLTFISLILKFITQTPSFLKDNYFVIGIFLFCFIIFSLIDKVYTKFVDKQKMIDGWNYLLKMKQVKNKTKCDLEILFESQNNKPDLNKIIEEFRKSNS